MGGVQAVQTATIVFALPFAGVMLLAIAKGPSESNSELCRVAGIAMATASVLS